MKLPALPQSSWPYSKTCYVAVGLGWLVYAALTLFSPQISNAQYHIASTAMEILRLTIILPIALAWLMGIRGATAFKSYATMIAGSPEASPINLIADGLLLTVAYFIVTAIIGAALPYYVHSAGYDSLIFLHDHTGSIFSLIAFYVLYRGSDQLHRVAKFDTWTRASAWILAAFAAFAIAFVLLFTSNQSASSAAGSRNSVAFVSSDILLVTLILPYLAGWFMGILTCVNISKFAAQVKGKIYRQALRDLVKGLWVVIVLSMLIQILTFASRYLLGMSLGSILLVVYALLIIYGLGFLFVRAGAVKLSQLEAFQ